jgi:D-alanyl-D-alanine carboxypeptidase/D-alanyl-D-alanine-endopeptidase (penicillin-binding protein 4)
MKNGHFKFCRLKHLILLLVFVCGCSTGVRIKKTAASGNIAENIEKYVEGLDDSIDIGIQILSVNTGKVIYQKNAYRYFIPASTLKIVTALSALSVLGNDFIFKTQVYGFTDNYAGKKTSSKNIYLKFSGNPLFTYQDLVSLFTKIKKKGIVSVNNLVIVKSGRNISSLSPNWMIGDVKYCYIAPVSDMTINRNITLFSIGPSTDLNKPAEIDSKINIYPVENKTITYNCPESEIKAKLTENSVLFTGCVDKDSKPSNICIAAEDMDYFISRTASMALKEADIDVGGNIVFADMPKNTEIFAEHKSDTLFLILRSAMKNSDNFVFDSVFSKIASTQNGNVKTWKDAGNALKEIIKKHYEVDLSDTVIVDGSGLSRYNLITPGLLTKLLMSAYHKFESFAEFISILPISYQDGTLKKRMPNLKGQVRAKTGALTGSLNRALLMAGYISASNGEVLAFTVMINGYMGSSAKYKKIQERICTLCR